MMHGQKNIKIINLMLHIIGWTIT